MSLKFDTIFYLNVSWVLFIFSIILFVLRILHLRIPKINLTLRPPQGSSMISFLLSVLSLNYSYQLLYPVHHSTPGPLFYTIISTFQAFTYDLPYDTVTETLASAISHNSCWKYHIAILLILAPLVGGATIITIIASLFPELKSSLSFWFWKILKKNIFVFSALNEQSVSLASDIEKNNPSKPLIVFGNCKLDSSDSEYESLLSRADSKGYLCLKRDLSTIKFWKKHCVKYYFVSSDDMANLDNAAYMADQGLDCWDNCQETTEMNVFSQSDIAKNILEEIIHHNEKPKDIRIVPYITNTIYYLFLRHPLFLCNHPTGELTVSIIGDNDWAIEFFKTILWYGQIPGINLNINCFVSNRDLYEDKLYYLIPELEQFQIKNDKGVPYCNWNVLNYTPKEVLADTKTNVWIVCSNLEQESIDTAFFICQNVRRPVEVFYQVRSDNISNAMQYSNRTALLYACNMHSFGAISEQYSRNNIEGCLYEIADGFEQAWKNPAKENTFEVEYKRRSSLAAALHLIYKLYHFGFMTEEELSAGDDLGTLIRSCLDENWTDDFQKSNAQEIGRMEHIRWIAYMRSIGYTNCSLGDLSKYIRIEPGKPVDTKNHFLKKHIALVPYEDLRRVSKKLKEKGTKRNLEYRTNNSVMDMKNELLKDNSIQEYSEEIEEDERISRDELERI